MFGNPAQDRIAKALERIADRLDPPPNERMGDLAYIGYLLEGLQNR